ncbi:MAG: sulfotransferase family protein [Microthrixaceae bacterium]
MSVPASPAIVVLDDLSAPRFDEPVQAILDSVGPLAEVLDLRPDAVIDQAVAEVGLEDLGDDADTAGFRNRLELLLDAYRTDAALSPMGQVSVHTLAVQLVRNRLLVQDLLRRHPEIHDIEIVAPIVIAGLPRTGTTHLHNLLAADPALRSLPYWESLEPVALPGDPPDDPDVGGESTIARVERARTSLDFLDAALPYLRRMHEMTPTHVHEEIQLLAIDASTMFFETLAPIPTWRDAYRAADQTPHYRYLRTVLQVLTFLRGGERWVLKSPQHLEQFGALLKVFPDAVVVVTHRDPVAVTASMATMVTYTSRLQLERVDPVVVGGYWIDRVADLLDACTRDRDLLPPGRSMDVRFHEFMADDLGTVEQIYELAGQPLDDGARAAHRDYLASHLRDRHGRVAYSLEPFGTDAAAVAARHVAYCRRFGVGDTASAAPPGSRS